MANSLVTARRGIGVAAAAAAAVLVAGARTIRAFLLRIAATARAHAPHVRGYLVALVRAAPVLARVYVHESRRALRDQRQAFVVWRESWREARRERAHPPDADEPLTRARAADVWVRTRAREYLRR